MQERESSWRESPNQVGETQTHQADRAYMGSFSERKGIERHKSDERDRLLGIEAVEKKREGGGRREGKKEIQRGRRQGSRWCFSF